MAALCAGNPPVLSAPEIAAIRTYVPQALCGVEHLIVAQDESGTPIGFMSVQENRLLDPEARGQGLGARLLCLGAVRRE